MALIADRIFSGYQQHNGLDLLIGMVAFTVQIYGDFSVFVVSTFESLRGREQPTVEWLIHRV